MRGARERGQVEAERTVGLSAGVAAELGLIFGVGANIVVVDAPPTFSPLWFWRTRCGEALRTSTVPVVVAARRSRPLRACVLAVRAGAGDLRNVPRWLESFDSLEAVIALESTHFMIGNIVGSPFPAAYLGGAGLTDDAADAAAHRAAQACRRALGNGLVIGRTAGSVEDGIAATVRLRRVDAVCLGDGTQLPSFGRTLRSCIDVLGVTVIVPPSIEARDDVRRPRRRHIAVLP